MRKINNRWPFAAWMKRLQGESPGTGRYFLRLAVPAVSLLLLITFAGVYVDVRDDIAALQVNEAAHLEVATNTITQDFESVVSDLRLLAGNADLLRYLDQHTEAGRLEAELDMLNMSRAKGWYDQICYLDANGMEVIRVNHSRGVPAVVPRATLQNKAGRYFFQETLKLKRGEVYVSPLDLNTDNGQIEMPYKPMIRFGTPVFDSRGRKQGVVLLNYYGAMLIEHMQASTGTLKADEMLLNREGYWLSSPQENDAWGFMLNKQRSFFNRYPEEWKTISSTVEGSMQTANGVFVFDTVFPLKHGQHHIGTLSASGNTPGLHQAEEYYWKVVSYIPPQLLPGHSLGRYPVAITLFFAALLLIVLASWYLARVMAVRQRLSKQAAASEERWNFALEGAGDGVWDWDVETGAAVYSDLWRSMLGYAGDEIKNKYSEWVARIHPDDLAVVLEVVEAYMAGKGKTMVFEHRLRCKDGSWKWILARGMAVARDANGKPLRLIGTNSDISERKLAEEKSRLNQQLLKTVTDAVPGMVTYWTKDLICAFSNTASMEWFGRSPKEMLGMRAPEVLGEEMYRLNEPLMRKALYGEAQQFERKLSKTNGEVRSVWVQYVPTIVNDKAQGFVVTVTDVTQIKQAEEALRESEQRLRTIFEQVPVGVALVDSLSGQFLNVNQRYCDIVGLSQEQMLAATFQSITHPDDIASGLDYLKQLKSGQISGYSTEKRCIRPDGSVVWVSLSTSALWQPGETPTQHVMVVEDISERKASAARELKLNAQLRQATKMEAIGHLTSGVAHDFNNILGAIFGYAELARHTLKRESAEGPALRYLDSIIVASERAKALVAQMMLFGRNSPVVKENEKSIVLLQPVVKEVVSLLRASVPATITLNLTGLHDDLRVNIQPVQLHQVLLNLGINGRDAIGEYGTINFVLGLREVGKGVCSSCNQDFSGSFVEIAVSDSGSGIPADILPNIFNPFFTTKEVGKGSGMGLAVAHGIVHLAGGHILVETAPGAGTTFRILLPLADAPAQSAATEALRTDDELSLSGLRIMVVDDEVALSMMMEELLSVHGARVNAFNQPQQALAAFMAAPDSVDAVITDESMPGLSGMDMAVQMLALRPQLPIVLCTGYSDKANPEAVAAVGIAGFMYKPVDFNVLIKRIRGLAAK